MDTNGKTVVEQLKDKCDCLKETDTSAYKFEQNVEQLINLISILTCWKRGSKENYCETFLLSERKELFDFKQVKSCGCCDNNITTLCLYYDLVKPESISVKLRVRNGIKFSEVEIDSNDISFDEIENNLYIDLSNYTDVTNNCNCDVLQKIIVTYDAGFEEIPDCLIPVFCDYLSYVIDMNKCECGCDSCDDDNDVNIDDIVNMDSNAEQLNTYVTVRNHIISAYAQQLSIMSLCGRNYFLGMVV